MTYLINLSWREGSMINFAEHKVKNQKENHPSGVLHRNKRFDVKIIDKTTSLA